MTWLPRLRGQLRQRKFPPEFRIAEPENIPVATEEQERPAPEPPNEPAEPEGLPDRALAELATYLWRGKRKLETEPSDTQSSAQRQAQRSLRNAWETLEQAGVEIHDFDQKPFVLGTSLEVLAYEERADVTGETVIETVKPLVYRAEKCIQNGQVIVGYPEKERENGARNS